VEEALPLLKRSVSNRYISGRKNGRQDILHGLEHVARRNPQRPDALPFEPSVTPVVTRRPVSKVVAIAIDFDGQLGGGAIEIENVAIDWVLSTKA
jgi:hypothetical protein